MGRQKSHKNRIISLTEIDDAETEANKRNQVIMKQFSATIETLKESINLQLSNIEMQFNNAILDLHKNDIMQLKQEINIIQQTNVVLEGSVAPFEKIINTWSDKINDRERHSRKNNLGIIGVPYTKDEDSVKT